MRDKLDSVQTQPFFPCILRAWNPLKRILHGHVPISFYFVWIFFVSLFSQSSNYVFNHLTIDDGLSQNFVICILQDHQGYMWFGTKDGLNRYDGYNFKIFKHLSSDQNSISDNYIMSLFEDKNGILWIGTENGGLNRFDHSSDTFTRFLHNPKNPNSLINNEVWSISGDQSGNLWIGTWGGLSMYDPESGNFINYGATGTKSGLSDEHIRCIYSSNPRYVWIGTDNGGLNVYDKFNHTFTQYLHQSDDPGSISHNQIQDIFQDSNGEIWLGTKYGVNKFDIDRQIFEFYPVFSGSAGDEALCIQEDSNGYLWIGNGGTGLFQLDPVTGQVNSNFSEPSNPYSISDSGVRDLLISPTGIIWIGTRGGGIDYFKLNPDFTYYAHVPGKSNSISSNSLRAIYETKDSILWVGSYGGLDKIDRTSGKIINYSPNPLDPHSLKNGNVYSIIEDNRGYLWIGTEGGGLYRMNRKSEQFDSFQNDPKNPSSISHQFVYVLFVDSENTLWIGTEYGLNKFNPTSETFIRYFHEPDNPNSLVGNTIRAIVEDAQGHLWIGTDQGISRFHIQSQQFLNYTQHTGMLSSLSENRIKSLRFDQSGILWIGTDGGGLNRMDPKKGTIYQISKGLPNDVVYGILEDFMGNLWLSTNNGIAKFQIPDTFPVDHSSTYFTVFTFRDGLQSNEFNSGSYFQSPSGEFFFGGINGLNSFYPHEIKKRSEILPLLITDFKIFNQSVLTGEKVNGRVILQNNIKDTKFLELTYQEFQFSFNFSALDYLSTGEIEYSYLLEGFDENWLSANSFNRIATFTNVPAGNYLFRLRASNPNRSINSKEVAIKITISPPIWKTWWAYVLYFLGFFGLIFGGIYWRVSSLQKRTTILENLVEERTTEIRNSEEKLNKQFSFLSTVIESLTHPFYVLDVNTKDVVMANSTARKENRLGHISCHALNQKNDGLPCGMSGMECPIRYVSSEKKPVQTEIEYQNQLGEKKWAEVNAYPIFDDAGNVTQMIEYYLDVTDRKILENSLKYNLEQRDKELTAKAMRMATDKESLVEIVKELQQVYLKTQPSEKHILKKLMSRLNDQISSGSEWDEFELWFGEVHKEFYDTLNRDYPNFSSREIKICAFLRLNLNTKEIASITNLTVKTIEVYRSNIRKKLNLSQGENLSLFLARL